MNEENNPPARITFVSHARTLAVREAAFPLDEPVEESGLQKLKAIGWTAPRAHLICAAPELRTRQTAGALGLDAVLSAELRDLDYGSWSGRSLDEVQSRDPDGVGLWLTDADAAPHGGESIANLLARTRTCLGSLQSSGHVIAVTHPAVIRAAILHVLDAPAQYFWRVEIPPMSITDLRWSGVHWKLRSSGCPLS